MKKAASSLFLAFIFVLLETLNVNAQCSNIYYADADDDGYGNPLVSTVSCSQPSGYVANSNDCDDTNDMLYEDCDDDGYTIQDGDCNDYDEGVYPGAFEYCYNGIDDNCNGVIDLECDDDGDGFTVGDGDCDDYTYDINPGAEEWCNEVDDDCDGLVDSADPDYIVELSYFDGDGDGYGDPLVSSDACPPLPGFVFSNTDCNDSDPQLLWEGSPCDDNDACTINDACTGGTCHGASYNFCDDEDVCTEDICVNLESSSIIWQNTIGSNFFDFLSVVLQTADGGYIAGGYSNSLMYGDKTENSQGDYDYWLIKLDAIGNIQWQNTIGGSQSDVLTALQQTDDAGYIVGGYSGSPISGDKTTGSIIGSSPFDYWILKLDASGNIEWQKTIGGDGFDQLQSLQQTADGGYIIGGFSNSDISGDKTENSRGGGSDYWLVKLNSTGAIQWQKTIGGNQDDLLTSVVQTSDGGYFVAGFSDSDDSGEKTESNMSPVGGYDFWVLKLNASGNIQWQNTIGGDGVDALNSASQTADGGYILAGHSDSPVSDDKTQASQSFDGWVVKLDASGNLEWQNTIGGGQNEFATDIRQTADNDYVLAGYEEGYVNDGFLIKLNTDGSIRWINNIRANAQDIAVSVRPTADGDYILGLYSDSGISGDKTENNSGPSDFWIMKIGDNLECGSEPVFPETLTCPADLIVAADAGTCSASPIFSASPIYLDCNVQSLTNDAPPLFTAGTTPVIWTLTDINNNTLTCTQQVTVVADCDDDNVCTVDVCSGASCTNTAISCDDGDACTDDSCHPVAGCQHTATSCDDSDDCTDDSCDTETGCVNEPLFPTSLTCPADLIVTADAGTCSASPIFSASPIYLDCNVLSLTNSASPLFTAGTTPVIWTLTDINNNTLTCTQQVTVVADCDDDNVCTVDACAGANCTNTPISCDDDDVCTTDSCHPVSGCAHSPLDCSDNDACTQDVCIAEIGCVNTAITCDDNAICTIDNCHPVSGCQHTANACDDSDACTNDICVEGTGCINTPITCESNLCFTGVCDAQSGECLYQPVACSDSDPCTDDNCDTLSGCFHNIVREIAGVSNIGSSFFNQSQFVEYNGKLYLPHDLNPLDWVLLEFDGETITDTIEVPNDFYEPLYIAVYDGKLFFGADKLYSYDGSVVTEEANVIAQSTLIEYNSKLYFAAYSATAGDELWMFEASTGTAALAVDIQSGTTGSSPRHFRVYNGKLYFSADGGDGRLQLWEYNGTTATQLSFGTTYTSMRVTDEYNGKLYLNTYFGASISTEMWQYDGTTLSLAPLSTGPIVRYYPEARTAQLNGRFYYVNLDGLCSYDGSSVRVELPSTNPVINYGMTKYKSKLYFVANSPASGNELWSYDGATAAIVADILPGAAHSTPDGFTIFEDKLYFTAENTYQLYVLEPKGEVDACVAESCVNGVYSTAPIDCDDSDACTVDACIAGVCSSNALDCNDNDACTIDGCEQGVCTHEAVNCDDTDLCTAEFCDTASGCMYGSPCDDINPCTIDLCYVDNDPFFGEQIFCVWNPVCQDNDVCTQDICNFDLSCSFPPVVCNDNDLCTEDVCIPVTGCTFTPSVFCDDVISCTFDICVPETGGCNHPLIYCFDGDFCTVDFCNPEFGFPFCVYEPLDCDDEDACTIDACDFGCTHTPVNCDDSDVCTIDVCDIALGCQNTSVYPTTIACPANIVTPVSIDACVKSGISLGQPAINSTCNVISISNNAPALFPVGTTGVAWKVMLSNGDSLSCAQLVTVVDVQNPTITCPADVTVLPNPGQCSVTAFFSSAATASDNCAVSTTNNSPASFPLGNTSITWTATDASGNTATCVQTITVNPNIEICNGIDDDCDGQTDEGCGSDLDEDGFASPLDCNDNDASVYPGAPELCNGIDDDCDAQIDEGLFSTAPTSITTDDADNKICPGSSITLTAVGGSLGSGAQFKWYSGSCGGTLAGTGNQITVTPPSSITYYVRAEGCNTTVCRFVSITLWSNPSVSISPAGTTTVCQGATTVLTASGVGLSYQWYLGATLLAGETAQTLTVNTSALPLNVNSQFRVRATNANGCSAFSAYKNVMVRPLPNANFTPVGNIALCAGATQLLTAPAGSSTYQWSRNGNPVGGNTASLSAYQNGTYMLNVTSSYGCTATSSTPATITYSTANLFANAGPDQNTLCEGSATLAGNTPDAGVTGTWTLVSGSGTVANPNVPTSTVTGLAPGINKFIWQLSEGSCSGAADTVALNVLAGSANPVYITAGGPVNFCSPGSVTLTAHVCGTGWTFRWQRNNTNITPAQTGQSYTITSSAIATYRVRATKGGVDYFSNTISINALPAVTINGPSAICPPNVTTTVSVPQIAGATYAWYKNNVAIPGATNSSYLVNSAGAYRCRIYYTATCYQMTNSVTITALSNCSSKMEEEVEENIQEEFSNNAMISAYPNPFSERLNIEFTLAADSRVKLEIFDLSGKQIAVLFEGDVLAGMMMKHEFTPIANCACMVIYRLQTEQGAFYGKAVMVK